MNSRILALSRCLRKAKPKGTLEEIFHFHFKGVLRGQNIKEIRVIVPDDRQDFIVNEDYLMLLIVDRIESEVLYAKSINSKQLV